MVRNTAVGQCCSSQRVSPRQSSSAHNRSAPSAKAQPISSSLPTATVFSSSIRPASSTATAVTDCLCTSTPITIIKIASSTVGGDRRADRRSEEHTSELQSQFHLVCRLLLEKKKRKHNLTITTQSTHIEKNPTY